MVHISITCSTGPCVLAARAPVKYWSMISHEILTLLTASHQPNNKLVCVRIYVAVLG